jgi:predicted transcriptional regulator
MSKAEYRQYLLNRVLRLETEPHRLSMEDVLENEIRTKVLNFIIDQPGIHYKELLRLSDVSPSTLAWHLDILETYKVIHKQRIGHFLIYYPFLDKNPFIEFDPAITKSKFTLDILQIVGDNPGIQQNHIAKRMESNRKTIQYHLSKLEAVHLIRSERSGRIVKYYAIIKEISPTKNDFTLSIEP